MLVTNRRYFIFIGLFYLISFVSGAFKDNGISERSLFVNPEPKSNKVFVINRNEINEDGLPLTRNKRDVPTPPTVHQNISTWTTHLNDSHQQLMVHWVGERSNVIICLARDSSPRSKLFQIPSSALYISYDYGKNFTNKTESFKLSDEKDSNYAQLDKFFNHPKYPEFCIFVDSTNKKLYYTKNNGHNISRSDLDFSPSELSFDEENPEIFVILDKVDPNRKLYLTVDGGKTFKMIQSFVKTFFWSSGPGFKKLFYVERWKPDGTSTILDIVDPAKASDEKKVFEDAKDFQIKGDFMFATKRSKGLNSTLDLYISHQRGPFYKAQFQTELDLTKLHIADVTDERIFVSVLHTESLANLYVSEISKNYTQYNFKLSLEQILCYFPGGNWKDTWLEDVTEDPFTDLYKVEGLKGIYIASRVESTLVSNIGPEHVTSLITYDHGATWGPIAAPTHKEDGSPINCHTENSCSLHLCQKFSQLYPVTRSASIMSSKSAPGIIMATGVMGKSLKGIAGVYLSRDAGLTWSRILKDYYFFNYGDHGGVLVAVKYFKSRGETRKILYSTNEGINWKSYEFNADDLRIYGLMTEPGENTTTFTMFGSAVTQHQWIIITIDLFNAFERTCTDDDYKFWSPSLPNTSISCVLGTRDTFQRRIAQSNCYNGIDLDRPVKKEICECSRRDYECDHGFMLSGNECVRNKSIKFDPYAVPSDCRPGQLYKRTKGYKKIDGDVCKVSFYITYEPDVIPCPLEESTEFLIVAVRDRIARIDLTTNATMYPVQGHKNIVALEFDLKNNCIYWADIEVDKIMRQCWNGLSTQEVIVETELSSIEGMALDWISQVLFFVDGMRKKIEAVRTDITIGGRMRTTILNSTILSKPRGICVHPKAGYLFWTDWDIDKPSVSRSNLDGTNVKKLFGKPIVQWPNGITIDQMAERIYWVDAMLDYIASADLNGNYFKRMISNEDKVSHPFAVAVLKDKMYWDDWKKKAIFAADKDTGSNVITLNDTFTDLMDLKVYSHYVQYGSNMCSYKNTSCETMCLGGPGNTFSCLCPDGFMKVKGKCVCLNGLEPAPNMTCPRKPGDSCDLDQFACKNGRCVPSEWRCNSVDDCGDRSDELGCPVCTPPMIACDDLSSIRCILPTWRCDGEIDCANMADEKNCGTWNCTATQFQCANGHCVEKKWLCDGDNDCKDWSDEQNCTSTPKRPSATLPCQNNGYRCNNSDICIPPQWVCDGERDCPGGEDETRDSCHNHTCAPYMFSCPNGKCIYRSWVCDGENDCDDDVRSDEKDCPSPDSSRSKIIPRPTDKPEFPTGAACLDWMFRCNNTNCIPYWWRCDGINDCGDDSDELSCLTTPDITFKPELDQTQLKCEKNQFTCSPGVCIPLTWVCDSTQDCVGGEDERGCSGSPAPPPVCPPNETPCADGKGCVLDHQLCDGVYDCFDHSDELKCEAQGNKGICPANFFSCDGTCISSLWVCNGHQDCYDGTDEQNCSSTEQQSKQIYKHLSLGVDQYSINSTSFLVSCWMAQQKAVLYTFLPSISKVSDGVWRNLTWSSSTTYRFTDLEPHTNYNVTVYVQDSRSNKTYPTNKYVNATTGEGVPSPPRRLTVRQLTGSRVQVIWDPPSTPRGEVRRYTLYYAPPLPPIERVVLNTSVVIEGYFLPNTNYSFWVTATNGAFTSNSSIVEYLMFDELGDVDDLVNASMRWINDTAVYLEWHKIRGVEGYKVDVRLHPNYVRPRTIVTAYNNVTVSNLPPGLQSHIEIRAYKASIDGKPFTIPITTRGSPHEYINFSAILLKDKKTAVQLKWQRPTSERYKDKNLTYYVLYLPTEQRKWYERPDLITSNNITTADTQVTIENLKSCKSYLFTVGMTGGPLARAVEILTREDHKAPVKELTARVDTKSSKMTINWRTPCDVVSEPVTYILEITELTRDRTSRYKLPPSMNVSFAHVIENVPVGGRYNICVHADIPSAPASCFLRRPVILPSPLNVVAWRSPNGHVMVSWHDPKAVEALPEHTYEVLLSAKEIPEDLIHPEDDVKVIEAKFSPLLTRAPPGAQDSFYVSVRTVSHDGYVSDLSEVQTLSMEGIEAEPSQSSSPVWWGVTGACLALVGLAAGIGLVVVRRLRAARTPHRATPRYSTRRGQATIADHDDDDVPPIYSFADDEPLVIA